MSRGAFCETFAGSRFANFFCQIFQLLTAAAQGKSRFPNDGTFRPNLATSLAGLLTRCFPNKLLDGISGQSKKSLKKSDLKCQKYSEN